MFFYVQRNVTTSLSIAVLINLYYFSSLITESDTHSNNQLNTYK
ncbi:hypothetical protein VCRLGP8_1350105 [Vibrio crassostreae]|nr:hypothetical protein VCRLGP8_1350105 [Vibrio crassostreae]CDT24163.1 hypothetical protein VCRLGP7_370270 [Vibrio crassostreae]CDT42967.1 hypothetical protein VCRLGP107_600105 [Vibrio crassostreae]